MYGATILNMHFFLKFFCPHKVRRIITEQLPQLVQYRTTQVIGRRAKMDGQE